MNKPNSFILLWLDIIRFKETILTNRNASRGFCHLQNWESNLARLIRANTTCYEQQFTADVQLFIMRATSKPEVLASSSEMPSQRSLVTLLP